MGLELLSRSCRGCVGVDLCLPCAAPKSAFIMAVNTVRVSAVDVLSDSSLQIHSVASDYASFLSGAVVAMWTPSPLNAKTASVANEKHSIAPAAAVVQPDCACGHTTYWK